MPIMLRADAEQLSYSNNEILIGVANSQSSTANPIGRELTAGSQAYFDLVNAKGGIKGRRVRMIVKDDASGPEPPVGVTNDLITREHALFLFDYVGTPTLLRVLPLLRFYEAEHIVLVGPMTGSEMPRKTPYGQYVFHIRASYDEEAQALVECLYAKGYRRFGFLGQQDAYGKSGELGVNNALKRHNLSIVQSVWYKRGGVFPATATMTAQVDALRRSKADAVIAFGVSTPCARFIRDVRMAQWNVPIGNISLVDADMLLDKLHEYSTKTQIDLTANLINSEVVPSPNESRYRLTRDFRDHVSVSNRGYTQLEGWVNAAVVAEALRRCPGELSRSTFWEALRSIKNWDPGLGRKLDLSTKKQQALNTVWVIASKQGQWSSIGELVDGHYEDHPW